MKKIWIIFLYLALMTSAVSAQIPTILTWENLHGPNAKGRINITVSKQNPSLIFVFQSHDNIYKSIDGGLHWNMLSAPKGETIRDLAIIDDNHLLLAANNHIYTSSDQGNHWVLSQTIDTACNQLFVLNPNVILLETNFHIARTNLYLSRDAGLSWEPAMWGIRNRYSLSEMGGRDNLLFIGANGLFVSENGGKRWRQPATTWRDLTVLSIAINRHHDVFLIASISDIYKTDPQGHTFEKITTGVAGNARKIEVDQEDNLYVLIQDYRNISSGLYQSSDNGRSFHLLYTFPEIDDFKVLANGKIIMTTNEGLILADQQNLSKLPFPFSLSKTKRIFALDDQHFYALDKILYRSTDAGKTWSIARDNDHIVDARAFNQNILTLEDDARDARHFAQHIFISRDQGENWENIYDIDPSFHSSCNHLFNQNGAFIVTCKRFALFTQDLIHWIRISKVINQNDPYLHARFSYYFDGKNLYATNGNIIQRSQDIGKTWTTLFNNLYSQHSQITGYQDIVLMAIPEAGILKLTNDAKDWDLINTGITDFHITDLAAINERHYVLATDNGIFYTENGGKNWMPQNIGLDNLSVLSLFANKQLLLIGTKGSGVFYSSLTQINHGSN